MITPAFKLHQNNEFLFINIKTPFVKLKDLDIFIDENDFRFYCKPYFLRLNLPASILENDEEIDYDFEERVFKLRYKKKTEGEHFEGLDLLTKLLTPDCPAQKLATNLIEEIDGGVEDGEEIDETSEGDHEAEYEDEIQWFIDQKLNEDIDDTEIKLTSSQIKYGFAQTKSNVFSRLSNEYELIIDLPDPDNNTQNRRKLRIDDENKRFDDDHYLADFFDNSEMIETIIMNYRPQYLDLNTDAIEYTEKDIETLKNLPKKKHLLDAEQKFYAYTGLIDILFAYCYNDRINEGEKNVESGWTIAKMSSTLSWFDTFNSLDQVLISSFRRSLCVPLYRNWNLSQRVLTDLLAILKKGQKLILKCLLDIRKTFIDGDNRYLLNDLYINDYCVWIQYASVKKLNALVGCLEKIEITKEMVGFDLTILELVANEQLNGGDEEINESDYSSEGSGEESSDDDHTSESFNLSNNNGNEYENEISASLGLKLNLNGNSENNLKEKPKIIELN